MQEGIEPTMEVRQAVPLQPFHKAATTRLYRGINRQRCQIISPPHYLFFFWVRLNSMWTPCKRFNRLQGRNPSFDSVLIYNSFRQVKYSCDTSSFTLSKWLVPTLWSLTLISSPSHRPSTFELCELLVFLSWTHNASKLCRWLGGNVQRIKHSLFYTAKFLTLCTPSSFFWVKGF